MADHTRLGDGRRRISDTADQPVWIDTSRQYTIRINGSDHTIGILSSELLEIPPGNPILERHHYAFWAHQRAELIDNGLYLVGLERHEHHILRSEITDAIGGGQASRHLFLISLDQLHTACLNRSQMWTAGDNRDFVARFGDPNRHVAANRTSPNYTYLHDFNSSYYEQRQTSSQSDKE